MENNNINKTKVDGNNLSTLNHLVGGHHSGPQKSIKGHGNYLFKPLLKDKRSVREIDFYETVRNKKRCGLFSIGKQNENHPDHVKQLNNLMPLLPTYYGVVEAECDGENTTYIKMEDITKKYRKACIADIKMGTRTYDDNATPEKKKYEVEKYPPQSEIGFRFVGMKVYQKKTDSYRSFDKLYGRDLTLETISNGIKDFIDNGQCIRKELIPLFRKKLVAFKNWFETQHCFRFYSSSLLFTYEGDSSLPLTENDVDIRIIDFAHAFPIVDSEARDEGYIYGINKLEDLLKHVEASK